MAQKRPRILIVEDDLTTGEVLVDVLSREGYDPVLTQSAVGASTLLTRARPQAVVLDLGLPFRSGAALLTELKNDPRTASIPIVICSGQPDALPLVRRALAAAVIAKPIDLERLLEALQAAITSGANDPPRVAA